jgi:hypothetical protein
MSVAIDTGRYGLATGNPAVKSVGPLAFGPDGIMFVADNASATIFAIDVEDRHHAGETRPIDVENLDSRLAAYLGCPREEVHIRDMAVHPTSQRVYLSVMRGSGDNGVPLIARLTPDGTLEDVSLASVRFSQTEVTNIPSRVEDPNLDPVIAARNRERNVAVTDMAYVDGVLLVAGASNEEFVSTLRRFAFPFDNEAVKSSLEIFHVSHGRYETHAPIRTFMPYGGERSILASYTCTPVVHFSLEDIGSATQLKGRTVAELGSGNTPVDIVSYHSDGEEYLLVSNTKHPLIKIACKNIDQQTPLTQPKQPVGVPREALPHEGVTHMANLNGSYVLMMQRDADANVHLRSYASATL